VAVYSESPGARCGLGNLVRDDLSVGVSGHWPAGRCLCL